MNLRKLCQKLNVSLQITFRLIEDQYDIDIRDHTNNEFYSFKSKEVLKKNIEDYVKFERDR